MSTWRRMFRKRPYALMSAGVLFALLSGDRARLEQLYGEAQRVETGNRPQGGARVMVEIPYRTTLSARFAP